MGCPNLVQGTRIKSRFALNWGIFQRAHMIERTLLNNVIQVMSRENSIIYQMDG